MLKKGDLIVSCQALEDEPLHSSFIMAKMALAAMQGGARGIRANSVCDIKAIKETVDLPIIGIIKKDYQDSDIYITATMKEIDELVSVGVEVIAVDATDRLRPGNLSLGKFFKQVKEKYPKQLFMADCSTIDELIYAEQIGFDYLGTTLFGYTPYSKVPAMADNGKLMREACNTLSKPIIAEGNINTPKIAKEASDMGCFAIVVGSMITRPQLITKTFSDALYN
ncbi:N-acetylmannosamine-6-phosphate 2-epimerase [Mollicutes bacterium LVI A0039]|nr:N-acetylmannosamine-6-phosphate 2-epimerase [Mollicutes bacterium LVI A0039]